ncbi:MAG: chaperonin GroEL [Tannerellaceae bacterium]
MYTETKFGIESRNAILRGVEKIASAVKCTLGPSGRNVVIRKAYGSPHVTKDGVTVAKEFSLSDAFEDLGAQLIKEVSSKSNDKVGDGTTTSVVLAEAICNVGNRYLASGHNPVLISRVISEAAALVVKTIRESATKIQSREDIRKVATLSANWDTEVGNWVEEAYKQVGTSGIVVAEESNGYETDLAIVEGASFDRGYISDLFINESDTNECVMKNVRIVIFDESVTSTQVIAQIGNLSIEDSKPVLIIAQEVAGGALQTMLVNNAKGVITCCAVRAPYNGDHRSQTLRDLAILTGASVISQNTGCRASDEDFYSYFGGADRVVVSNETTVISGAHGSQEAIDDHVKSLRVSLSTCDSEYEKDMLNERIARMAGGVASIRVGGMTETEIKEKKDRYDDALCAVKSALSGGVVSGGGAALIHAVNSTSANVYASYSEYNKIGMSIIKEAASVPLLTMLENAGLKDDGIVRDLIDSKDTSMCYDIKRETRVNASCFGILDPADVVCFALSFAASIAGLILTTQCAIIDQSDTKLPR